MGKEPASSKAVSFAFAPAGLRALRAHSWPGNLRELEHLVAATALFSLADALQAAEAGRASGPGMRTIPIPLKLVHELLQSPGGGAAAPASGQLMVDVSPAPSLHQLTRTIESQILARLFDETDGDFERMAARQLQGHAPGNARRVRFRFNQLGLRARRRHQSRFRHLPPIATGPPSASSVAGLAPPASWPKSCSRYRRRSPDVRPQPKQRPRGLARAARNGETPHPRRERPGPGLVRPRHRGLGRHGQTPTSVMVLQSLHCMRPSMRASQR
jgi:hypothetical protein